MKPKAFYTYNWDKSATDAFSFEKLDNSKKFGLSIYL